MSNLKCLEIRFGAPIARITFGMNAELNSTSGTVAQCCAAAPRVPQPRTSPDSEARQRLLLENLSEVRHIARRIHGSLPRHVAFDDLVHSGVLGLMDAVQKFDPAKKACFRTYSQFRIRGAILDSLRDLDWSPRSLRRQARRIELANSALASRLGRVPSEPEIAAHLGLRLHDLQNILKELHGLTVVTWQPQLESSSQAEVSSVQPHRPGEDPFEVCLRAQGTRMLSEAIDTLQENERRALAHYYFEERTMKEVGRLLHVHESRVSQIISGALHRLRVRLLQQLWPHKREPGPNSARHYDEIARALGVPV
jgi:RNA polymerase sigma factor for flagellar operon FliA